MLPLISLTLLGDAVLIMKFSGNLADDIIAVFSAVVLSLFSALILKRFYKYTAVKFVFIVLIILSALFTVLNFSLFASEAMLKGEDMVFPFVIFSALVFYLGLTDKKVICKTALVSGALTALLIIAITVLSIRFMSAKYLLPHSLPELSASKTFTSVYFSLTAAFVPILTVIKKMRELISPAIAFAFLFTLGLITPLGHFGSEYAATLSYPYAVAVSSAAQGDVFSRLDGLFFFSCFFTCLTKAAVCIYALRQIYIQLISKIKS